MAEKIGAGHAEAMARLGLRELRNAFNPARDSIADNELGLYGTATQTQINEEMTAGSDGQQPKTMKEIFSEQLEKLARFTTSNEQENQMTRERER